MFDFDKGTWESSVPNAVSVAGDYHDGQFSMLYAFSSTGYLAIGDEGRRLDRDNRQWLTDLANDLLNELDHAIGIAEDLGEFEDADILREVAEELDGDLGGL